jgi:hypothetical protein
MALDNYQNLKATVLDWLTRSDLTNQVEEFIRLFEASCWPKFQGVEDTTTVTLTTTAGNALVALPAGVKTILAMRCGDTPIKVISPSVFASYEGEQGKPGVTSQEGSNLRLSPVPDSDYTISLTYTGAFPRLSSTVATNWLLDNHPNAYLYGAMKQAKAYLREDMVDRIDGLAQEALDSAVMDVQNRRLNNAVTCWAKAAV